MARGTRGAYRREDRVSLPPELQKELVEKAATKYGNCQELAKHLDIPKSSVHYYRVGRLTMPVSVLERMLEIAGDQRLKERVEARGITKDRSWANEYAVSVYREMCREKLRLPTRRELEQDDDLRRKAASIISYVLAEGSVWVHKDKWDEACVNITLARHEDDLYDHFRSLCSQVFGYDIGPSQFPGNGAVAIRGFIYTRFLAEWFVENGVFPGDKSSQALTLPSWVMGSSDPSTWVSALQPWCDGEGCASSSGFRIAQSRHTTLDLHAVPAHPRSMTQRRLPKGALERMTVHEVNALEYCAASFPSEILGDVKTLFNRLGLRPRLSVSRLHLKDDGFWSCVWELRFNKYDARSMLRFGLVTQRAKKERLAQI
jgi:hypothetical protein